MNIGDIHGGQEQHRDRDEAPRIEKLKKKHGKRHGDKDRDEITCQDDRNNCPGFFKTISVSNRPLFLITDYLQTIFEFQAAILLPYAAD